MAYRQSTESELSPPPSTPVFWTVYSISNHKLRTRVFTRTWFEAREKGCTALMISISDCKAVRHYENLSKM